MNYHIIKLTESDDLDGRSFVGVSSTSKDKLSVTIPYGLDLPCPVERTDKKSFSMLKLYIKTIQKALNSKYVRKQLESQSSEINHPLAAINIVHDFIINGLYNEFELDYIKNRNGNIDFKKTIQKVNPQVIDDEYYYDTFITKRKKIITDNTVSIAQANVINHFMENGGEILFGSKLSLHIEKVRLDEKLITKLHTELIHSFNSRKQCLIRWLIDYIEGIRINDNPKGKGNWNYAIIGSTFWEEIIEKLYSNQATRDRVIYGKRYEFTSLIDGSSVKVGRSTQHDTIYEDINKIIIIDAKFYYQSINLLKEDVLGKQFGYYSEAKLKKPHKTIINILILPSIPELGESPGFSKYVIPDRHSRDPYKIIFIYKLDMDEAIKSYYFGKKKSSKLVSDFINLINDTDVKSHLSKIGVNYIIS